MYTLAAYICEKTLEEMDALHFLPSMIAASAVYLARLNCNIRPWVSSSSSSSGGGGGGSSSSSSSSSNVILIS